jgi:selenide,water dikinase
VVRNILQGGAAACSAAGIPVAGGHSIDAPEPIYGLAVIGVCRPEEVRRNADAKAGDALILTKAIGVGVYSAAIKKGALSGDSYAEMLASTTLLNRVGCDLAKNLDVHAMTDVTGFGILGHALEMARGSSSTLVIRFREIPFLNDAERLAREGLVTGASKRNWLSYGDAVALPEGTEDWQRNLLTDPQTSGGLLVACAAKRSDAILQEIRKAGYPAAGVIGRVEAGPPRIRVER